MLHSMYIPTAVIHVYTYKTLFKETPGDLEDWNFINSAQRFLVVERKRQLVYWWLETFSFETIGYKLARRTYGNTNFLV